MKNRCRRINICNLSLSFIWHQLLDCSSLKFQKNHQILYWVYYLCLEIIRNVQKNSFWAESINPSLDQPSKRMFLFHSIFQPRSWIILGWKRSQVESYWSPLWTYSVSLLHSRYSTRKNVISFLWKFLPCFW